MAIDPTLLTYRIFILFEFIGSGMSVASVTYTGWYVLKTFSVNWGDISPENVLLNSAWFLTISLLLFDIMGLGCFLYSIALMITPVKAGYVTHIRGRILILIVLGFGAFGTSAMGGIIAGGVCWFAAVCDLLALLLTKLGCLTPWTEAQRVQNEEDEREAKAKKREIKQEQKEREKAEKAERKAKEKEEKAREKEEKAREKEEKAREKAEREERQNEEQDSANQNQLTLQTDDDAKVAQDIPL